ncbi:hypothetical protein V2J09_002965 [Rumex salicifolius]
MASSNSLPSVNLPLPEKSVQELSQSEVPGNYIYKNATKGTPEFDAPLPEMDCPSIDLEILGGSSSEAELNKFRSMLTTWGCFQLENHGMSSSELEEMRGVVRQFFELPLEEKQRYARPIDDMEGYGADTYVSEDRVLDWTDRMYLTTQPVHKRKLQFWPQNPSIFKEKFHEYSVKMQEILQVMLKAMAKSLGLEDSAFVNEYKENGSVLARLNMYPKCGLPDRVLGLHPHTDGSVITVVLQDKQVEGLQVLKDDQWFKVPVNPNALFVNVGNQLEIMSNGIFRSPLHRVVTSADKERMTLAMFCYPDQENEIGPLKELITEDRPQMFRRVTNYNAIFFKQFQLGETPLLSVKIN